MTIAFAGKTECVRAYCGKKGAIGNFFAKLDKFFRVPPNLFRNCGVKVRCIQNLILWNRQNGRKIPNKIQTKKIGVPTNFFFIISVYARPASRIKGRV
jgi:hypothetical protein